MTEPSDKESISDFRFKLHMDIRGKRRFLWPWYVALAVLLGSPFFERFIRKLLESVG